MSSSHSYVNYNCYYLTCLTKGTDRESVIQLKADRMSFYNAYTCIQLSQIQVHTVNGNFQNNRR